MRYSPAQRFARNAKSILEGARKTVAAVIAGAPTEAEKTLALGREFAAELKEIVRSEGPALAQKAVKKGTEQLRAKVEKLPVASKMFRRAS
jgi:F0F1-type ATP synthase membrane subunit b/b'